MILAIESSCDETAAAVIDETRILSNVVSSQYFHRKFGGVVPELASRAHLQYISEVTSKALEEAGLTIQNMSAIAVTAAPGLIGSLIVGTNFAKGLSLRYGLPIIPVDHIEGHIYSSFIQDTGLEFPIISLVVSGGHTAIFHVKSYEEYDLLGTTVDDAAGEAFDKIASLFGLPYPGGPEVDKLAARGNPKAFNFPRSMITSKDYNFSFSGLKTSVRYYLQNNFQNGIPESIIPDLCASIQAAIVEVLVYKTICAAKAMKVKTVAVSGGVSANSELRFKFAGEAERCNIKFVSSDLSYCTDNAAMIGFIASRKLNSKNAEYFNNLMFIANPSSLKKKMKEKKNN
ncbi:MAG: tRNA N6-adenosine threonylcarbamoyltransferase [Ignavibacteria bacterium]|nr:tRNA N6-adenosine threonylcarbamoyltransferase [Ignavibacteria bacterium]